MFRVVLLFACLAACSAHAVLPLAHAAVAPVIPYSHGYGGLGLGHGYAGHGIAGHGYTSVGHLGYAGQGLIGHGYAGHGLVGHGYGHHVLKRSPHYVPVGHLGGIGHGDSFGHLGGVGHSGGVGHVGAIGHITPVVSPVAVSHQSRVDVRSSPALVAPVLPVVNPVVTPLIHPLPVHHAPLAPLHYGGGHYGSAYSNLGHY